MAQILKKGIKYIKINKVDAFGNDKTQLLKQLQNIRLVYSDLGVKQYTVYNATEYPTYIQYQVNYTNVTSSTDTGVLNYIAQATSSTGTWAGPWISDDPYTTITAMTSAPISNSRFNTSSGVYQLQSTTLEHYPNTTVQITASIAYAPEFEGGQIYPQLLLRSQGGTVLAIVTASNNTAGTLTLTASLNSATIAPLVQSSRKAIFFQVFNNTTEEAAIFSNFRLRINQADNPTSYAQRLVVPSPNTALKFEGTDCDVTYGWVDQYDLSQYFMDVDYTTGLTIPTNQTALVAGTAPTAPVKDYYYTLQAHTKPRYEGSRVSQLYLNKYTGPSTTLLVEGSPYIGDTGYGKSPNVESRRAYVGWFTDVRGASPEFNNAVNINVRYLIDKAGDTYSPQLTNYFLSELRGVFTDGEILNLNFVDNIAGTNSTPSVIKSQLNGERAIIRAGARAAAILYSQTGSAANAFTSSITFTAGDGVQAQVVPVDFRFGAVSRSLQAFEQNVDTSLKFPQENWDFSNYYTASTSQYQFGQTPTSDINFIVKAQNLTNLVRSARSACQIKILKNGVVIGGKRLELDTRNSGNNIATAVVAETGFQQFQTGDIITAQLYVEPSTETYPITADSMEFIMDQRSISQIALSTSAPITSPYLFTGSANASIITASSQFKSYIGYGIQTQISESGFDPTNIPLSFNLGDQFRFENDEGKVYSIARILSSSVQTPNGETYIQLDRTITPGTNINYFVLRRFIEDPTNILVQGVKGSGATGPGSIKAQATVQELEDSLPAIISRLNSENTI